MPAGRPTSFKPEYVDQARKLALRGWTDVQLADFFDVNVSTIYQWKKAQPEFSNALKVNKEEADEMVRKSLYQRAMGWEDDDGKRIPPDTTAGIFWLKNRQPDQWRDKREVEAEGNLTLEIVRFSEDLDD